MAFDLDNNNEKNGIQRVFLKPSVARAGLFEIFLLDYHQTDRNALIGSPSEAGLQQLDNKVTMPTVVEFRGIVKTSKSKNVFGSLRAIMRQVELEKLKCEFQTKSGKVKKMLIENLEEVGESSRYDGVEIKARLLEYLEHNLAGKKGDGESENDSGESPTEPFPGYYDD